MRNVIALVLLAGISACAVSAPIGKTHPASPAAPVGRLAGAPASLRPGVIEYKDVPGMRMTAPPDHHHHHGH